jgi:hypothetical protein
MFSYIDQSGIVRPSSITMSAYSALISQSFPYKVVADQVVSPLLLLREHFNVHETLKETCADTKPFKP